MTVPTTTDRAVLRETLYALTRPVGDLAPGTMVADPLRGLDPCDGPGALYVQDGAGRGAWITPDDVERVTGLVVLVDHTEGWSSAFPRLGTEDTARRFATATMGLGHPVVGVWVGEVIRQQ